MASLAEKKEKQQESETDPLLQQSSLGSAQEVPWYEDNAAFRWLYEHRKSIPGYGVWTLLRKVSNSKRRGVTIYVSLISSLSPLSLPSLLYLFFISSLSLSL